MLSNIDFSKSDQYILSIRFSTDGFYFYIHDCTEDSAVEVTPYYIYKPDGLLSMTANFKKLLKEQSWLNHDFKRLDVIVDSQRFTLVPLDFFEDDQVTTIFYHNLSRHDNETVKYNILPTGNAVVLFGMDNALYNLLRDRYADVQFYAQASSLLKYALRNGKKEGREMYCCVELKTVTVAAVDGGNIVQACAFVSRSISDSLYYVLYSWKQLLFDQLDDRLTIIGSEEMCSQLKSQTEKFVKDVHVVQNSDFADFCVKNP